jgi:conjugative transfer region protein TrbK
MKAWLRLRSESQDERHAAVVSLLRFAVIAFVVAVVIIAIGEASRTDDASRDVAPAATKNDPLAADFARCRDVTAEQMASDDTCRRVWAENRRRFFAPNNKPGEAR